MYNVVENITDIDFPFKWNKEYKVKAKKASVLPFIFYRCWQRKKKIDINTMEEEKNEEENWGL